MLERTDSEYSLSLQYLVKSYTSFVDSLAAYLSMPLTASCKLQGLISVWTHPRGIHSLIRTLALEFDQPTSLLSPFATSDSPAPLSSSGATRPFEVPNPLFGEATEVKLEEAEDASSELRDDGQEDEPSAPEEQAEGEGESTSQRYKRGPYKSYSMAEKERAVRLLLEEEMPITEISRKLQIPCKNIKRWSTEGVYRKRGGGRRRSTPEMEDNIIRWLKQSYNPGQEVDIERLQEYALAISNDPLFKASRGWVLKFIDRYKLRSHFTFH